MGLRYGDLVLKNKTGSGQGGIVLLVYLAHPPKKGPHTLWEEVLEKCRMPLSRHRVPEAGAGAGAELVHWLVHHRLLSSGLCIPIPTISP